MSNFDDLIERLEAFFIKLARRQDVDRLPHVRAFAIYADHIGPHHLAAHLTDGFERVIDLKFVRPAPGIFALERKSVLDHQQVGNIDRDESIGLFAQQELIALARDELIDVVGEGKIGFRGN